MLGYDVASVEQAVCHRLQRVAGLANPAGVRQQLHALHEVEQRLFCIVSMSAKPSRAQALPYTREQARLMKGLGLQSQWTTFSLKNADLLSAIAHIAHEQTAPCHTLIHARSSCLVSNTSGLTPRAKTALQLSISAVALTCVARKAAAAKQMHAIILAFGFCQTAIRSSEHCKAHQLQGTALRPNDMRHVQAIFVLTKLCSLQAMKPSDLRRLETDSLEQATRAMIVINKHLLLSTKQIVGPLHTDEVQQASILAVISVQTALSILRKALKSSCADSPVIASCACMALQSMLCLRRILRAAREAASTLIDSGTWRLRLIGFHVCLLTQANALKAVML